MAFTRCDSIKFAIRFNQSDISVSVALYTERFSKQCFLHAFMLATVCIVYMLVTLSAVNQEHIKHKRTMRYAFNTCLYTRSPYDRMCWRLFHRKIEGKKQTIIEFDGSQFRKNSTYNLTYGFFLCDFFMLVHECMWSCLLFFPFHFSIFSMKSSLLVQSQIRYNCNLFALVFDLPPLYICINGVDVVFLNSVIDGISFDTNRTHRMKITHDFRFWIE